MISPIYQIKKTDSNYPNNYKGGRVTVLRCLVKLFTSIINDRLSSFCWQFRFESQADFRMNFSASDYNSSLHSIVELMFANKKKLCCAFIDLKGH